MRNILARICFLTMTAAPLQAQVGPARAHPIIGASKPLPTMFLDQKDRKMVLEVPLPANYTTVFGTKTWWQIRYTLGSAPTDRTTFLAALAVRLH